MQRLTLNDGQITLLQGNCLDWLPKIKDNVIDLVIADPPYYGVTKEHWDRQWPNKQKYLDWSRCWLSLVIPKMRPSASLYLWGGIGEKSDTIIHLKLLCDELGLHFKDWITWQKSRGMGNRRGWLYTREECLWYVKDNNQFYWNEANQYDLTKPTNRKDLGFNGQPRKSKFKRYTNIWTNNDDQDYGNNRVTYHYTPKPLPLIERIVLAHTNENAVVLDPFFGSGSTAKVCLQHNRRFIGCEIEPSYFETLAGTIRDKAPAP